MMYLKESLLEADRRVVVSRDWWGGGNKELLFKAYIVSVVQFE